MFGLLAAGIAGITGVYGHIKSREFVGQRLRYTLAQPHEAPARGMENDRAPRKSSYVKDFKAINMGVMEMKKGNGELTLRALNIPDQEALEFRLLMLRRLAK